MIKSKKALSALLSVASVAGVVAPSVTTMAAEQNVNVGDLVTKAETSLLFADYQAALVEVQKLPQADQGQYVDRLVKLFPTLKEKDAIVNIVDQMKKFVDTKDAGLMYDLLQNQIPNKIKEQANKNYLMNELASWGKKFIDAIPGYVDATDAIIAAWAPVKDGNVAETQAKIDAAQVKVDAVKKVAEGTGKYLQTLLDEVKTALSKIDRVTAKSLDAVGSKKLKVTFNKAVEDATKLDLKVKRDNVNLTITKVEWNEAKTEATLTTSYNLQDGKYSVTSVYNQEKATSVENVDVKEAKVSKISFVANDAIITDASGAVETPANTDAKQGIVAKVKVENQYGEDVTDSVNFADLSVTSSKGTPISLTKGTLKITDTSDFAVDQKVVVTVVHKATATVSTATLNVVQSTNVNKIELSALTTDDADLKGKDVYVGTDHTKFYLPITVKDQYGNALSAADLTGLTIISSNTSIVNPKTVVETIDKKTVIKLQGQTGTATNGTAVITVVSPSGVSANIKVDVKENGKIDSLKLEQPETELKQGDKIAVPFTALDQYGNALVSKDDLGTVAGGGTSQLTFNKNGANTTISATNATLSTKVDYVNKNKLIVELTPNAGADKVILTVITSTGKVQNLTWNVSAKRVATTIAGLNTDFYTLMQAGQTQSINLTNDVKLKDQYGDDIALASGYSIQCAKADGTIDAPGTDNVSFASNKFTATAGKNGSTKYKVTLKDDAKNKVIDQFEFDMEAVALKNIAEFGIKDLNKQYTGAVNPDYNQKVEIYGKKDGKKVAVDQALIRSISITNSLTINAGALEAQVVKTDNADKTATLTVLVEGAEAPITLTKSVTYNDATPKAQTMDVKKGKDIVKDSVIALDKADITDISATGNGTFKFDLKDQYNVVSKDVTFTVTNMVDADATKDFEATIDKDGKVAFKDAQGTAGDSFVINAVTGSGLTKSIKVVLND